MGVNCRCFDTLRTKVGQIPENINSSSSDHRIAFLLVLVQIQEDGRDKENKCLVAAKTAFSSENNKPLTVLAWV